MTPLSTYKQDPRPSWEQRRCLQRSPWKRKSRPYHRVRGNGCYKQNNQIPENDTNLRQSWTDPTTSKNYNGKEHIAGIRFLPCFNKGKVWGPVNWWQEVPTRRLDTDLFEFSFVRLSLLWWCSDEQKLFLRYRNRSPLLPLRTPHLQ